MLKNRFEYVFRQDVRNFGIIWIDNDWRKCLIVSVGRKTNVPTIYFYVYEYGNEYNIAIKTLQIGTILDKNKILDDEMERWKDYITDPLFEILYDREILEYVKLGYEFKEY